MGKFFCKFQINKIFAHLDFKNPAHLPLVLEEYSKICSQMNFLAKNCEIELFLKLSVFTMFTVLIDVKRR